MADSRYFTGFLHRLENGRGESMRELLIRQKEVSDWEVLIDGAWYEFTWRTYKFLLRESRDRFLLVSNEHTHAQLFLEAIGLMSLVRRPRILISDFVNSHVPPLNDPNASFSSQYRISNVFASIDGYGRSLQTMALWGDDMLNSEMFLSLLTQVKPYRVTVRDPQRNADVASVSSTGGVNFFFGANAQLRRVDTLLRYLNKASYIKWEPDSPAHNPHEDLDESPPER